MKRFFKEVCFLRQYLKSLDRLRGHPLLCLIPSERGTFRALKRRPVRQRAGHSLGNRLFCGPLKMRRVPQEPVLRTARIFRTTGGLLRYRMSRMPQMAEERSLFPRQHYRKSNKHQKKRPLPKTAPSANSPQPQSRGSREIFIQAAVLPRMDLTIF